MTLPPGYFDALYAADPDPWGFASRWYETRKYALSLAALPRPRFASVLEIGCSIGVFTAQLAARSDQLLALDPSAAALAEAAQRAPAGVRFTQGSVPDDWPAGAYDLVVLSEVGYYLAQPDLERLLDLIHRDLAPGGCVLACHWRHPVADYPLTGDEVHDALGRWPSLSCTVEDDFRLEVLLPRGGTGVARAEGLV